MREVLESFLALADLQEAVLDSDALAEFPPILNGWLTAQSILVPAAPATHIGCSECDEGHVEPVVHQRLPSGELRFTITCPEAGLVQLPSSALRRWRIDIDRLVLSLAITLCDCSAPEELVDERCWRLGALSVAPLYSAVLIRGLHRTDSLEVLARVSHLSAPDRSVLMPLQLGGLSNGAPNAFVAIVPVHAAIRWRKGTLVADSERIESAVPQSSSGNDVRVDPNTRTVFHDGRQCTFSSHARAQFELFNCLFRRRGQPVYFETMRSPGGPFSDYDTTDASGRTAVKRVRDRLKATGQRQLAAKLKTASGKNGAYAILES